MVIVTRIPGVLSVVARSIVRTIMDIMSYGKYLRFTRARGVERRRTLFSRRRAQMISPHRLRGNPFLSSVRSPTSPIPSPLALCLFNDTKAF